MPFARHSVTIKLMSNMWDKKKQGVDQKSAEEAAKGVNKSASEVLSQSWKNLKDAFSGESARANTTKQNVIRKDGGYPGNR